MDAVRRTTGFKTGKEVRTLLVGAPDAYAATIAKIVIGPVTVAYNETEKPHTPAGASAKMETAAISNNTLPFGDFVFDQVILIHALEFSPSPVRLMREVQRVTASDGRVVTVATNRQGIWAWFHSTPFGDGSVFSTSNIREIFLNAELSPTQVQTALFTPPMDFQKMPWASQWLEKAGQYLSVDIGGAVVAAAIKQRYAGTITPQKSRAPESTFQLAPARS